LRPAPLREGPRRGLQGPKHRFLRPILSQLEDNPGNAILPNGVVHRANQEIGVPGYLHEVLELISESSTSIEVAGKPRIISALQLFAFYAPFSDVYASHIQILFLGL
jgi:hypothetical protein